MSFIENLSMCIYIYVIPNSLGHSARKALVKRRIRREGWIFGAGERISRQASQPGQEIRCSDEINISWHFFSNLATQPSWSDVHFKWRKIFRLQAMLRSTCFRVEGLAGWAVTYIAGSNAASKSLNWNVNVGFRLKYVGSHQKCLQKVSLEILAQPKIAEFGK